MYKKQILSWITGDVLPLLHEIPKLIQAFLPPVHELEYATVAEVCFNVSQSCMCGLLDCLITFAVLAPHAIF
jgi:hypothetical protein